MKVPLALSLVALVAGCGSSAAGGEPATSAGAAPAPAPIEIRPGFALVEREVTPRGVVTGARCKGSFPEAPQLTLSLPENVEALAIEVPGDGVSLLVRQGRHVWCGSAQPGLTRLGRGAWSQGDYEILVGRTEPGDGAPTRLRIVDPER